MHTSELPSSPSFTSYSSSPDQTKEKRCSSDLRWCVCHQSSHAQLFVTPWTLVHQVPLSMGFPRQEYWSRLPFSCSKASSRPRDLTCVCLHFLHWQADSLPLHHLERCCKAVQNLLNGLRWRSLVCCSPWGHSESDTTERLHVHFSPSCIGEGNGNPLQCSCLENPRDGGAWWAAVYGVAQSRTRLK